ncbi:hypothetical protein H6H01_07035 [Nostoc calcicola FACHB-3891]|nr:hypothetical protein [Nostoc calcicola FACHB-3891]
MSGFLGITDRPDLRPEISCSKPMSAGTTVGVKMVEKARPLVNTMPLG